MEIKGAVDVPQRKTRTAQTPSAIKEGFHCCSLEKFFVRHAWDWLSVLAMNKLASTSVERTLASAIGMAGSLAIAFLQEL